MLKNVQRSRGVYVCLSWSKVRLRYLQWKWKVFYEYVKRLKQ